MTIPASAEFDPTTTVPLWQLFAADGAATDPAAWGRERARTWRDLTGGDEQDLERVARFFSSLVGGSARDGFAWRGVYLLSPDFGATVVDLALVEDVTDLEVLVQPADASDLRTRSEQFEHDGHSGLMSVQFIHGDSEGQGTISATVSAAVRREVAPYGKCVLLARCDTRHLDALMSAIIPLQFLLTSENVLDLVSGPA